MSVWVCKVDFRICSVTLKKQCIFAQNKNRHKFPKILDVCRNVEYNAASDWAKMHQKIINELLKTESAQKQAKAEGSDESCMAAGMESNKHL